MATPRKQHKVRDKDATMRALKDAVGEILRESGFHQLSTTAITRHVGKDKNLIRYHFGGLGALLSAYVAEKDHWPPFLERFAPTEPVSAGELEAAFTELMEENFRYFADDPEMQQVIRWQASQYHPVLHSASARREKAGGALIRLTQRWFAGTGIHFGAVLAIVLGGSYFPVLQCAAGNGAFCGLDTVQPRDREILQRTIGQIIRWAWRAAVEDNRHKTTSGMNLLQHEYDKLNTLATGGSTGTPGGRPDPVLLADAKRMEALLLAELINLTNETQIRLFLKVHLNRLVALCDRLYDADAPANPHAEAVVGIMEALRGAASDMLPDDVILPALVRDNQSREVGTRWASLRQTFADMGIDEVLLDIMDVPLLRFANREKPVTWLAFRYLRKYLGGLEGLPMAGVLNDWLVCERLIGLGFNHPRFAGHLTRKIRERAASMDSRLRQECLLGMRQRVLQVPRLTMMRFARDMPPIVEELARWLDAEASGQHTAAQRVPNVMKLNTTFKATQLALWQKLLYDHGVYDEANLDLFSEKVAHGFTTRSQESLSPASIKSKFYSKEPGDIRALKKLLDNLSADLGDFGVM